MSPASSQEGHRALVVTRNTRVHECNRVLVFQGRRVDGDVNQCNLLPNTSKAAVLLSLLHSSILINKASSIVSFELLSYG